MLQAVKNVLKIIFFKLYLNLIGAVYLVKENVVRPRRLPDYTSQGKGIHRNRFPGYHEKICGLK